VIISAVYLLVRCLLSCLTVLTRHQVSKDAELLVLRHENTVLRRQIGRVRYEPGDRLWLAALSRLVPRCRWAEVFAVTPATLPPRTGGSSRASGTTPAADDPDGRPRQPPSASS
jgi:putative transposase